MYDLPADPAFSRFFFLSPQLGPPLGLIGAPLGLQFRPALIYEALLLLGLYTGSEFSLFFNTPVISAHLLRGSRGPCRGLAATPCALPKCLAV